MIDTATLELYKPQRIFLVQGDIVGSDELVHHLKEHNTLVHTLIVSRFTVEHAETIATFATEGDGSERIFVVYFSVFSSS